MRIVIVGGSGNVGTAVLRAAIAAGHTVHAVSRRGPATGGEYDAATWHSIDLTTPAAPDSLREVFAGADAVVHAGWAIQPSHDRERLRAVNVLGSRAVLEGVQGAGVPHLVYLSSVGAYAPRTSLDPVDESWPATGLRTSSYSEDKAAVEAMLDRFEAANGATGVTRLRPALILQRDAAAEIQRYFIGAFVPRALWGLARGGKLPVLPVPRGLVLQFVHASDVADAVLAAAERGVRGAVNLASAPVLDAQGLSRITGGRVVPVPAAVVRGAVDLAWRAKVLPTSPGWIDLALSVPVMDTERAADVLGWRPAHAAPSAVADLLDGLAEGAGVPSSPALRP
ncbi:NAD-dependent epimerase/dehydratase family protein [Actinokineospora bangkokensis]|uniref:NAD-dependent dehydratase n=1 Tax=Actinokineospora bangkokensis TaxID=1193682 RepID=A0A1Q9LLP8_9PSEU|nr:NAD-dependent epimerase/dehydratase family protein [Actinokineospora bangkokensis]OLR92958.1 NAD-dependent dehydratase [Actinokineospora bangkokensis]